MWCSPRSRFFAQMHLIGDRDNEMDACSSCRPPQQVVIVRREGVGDGSKSTVLASSGQRRDVGCFELRGRLGRFAPGPGTCESRGIGVPEVWFQNTTLTKHHDSAHFIQITDTRSYIQGINQVSGMTARTRPGSLPQVRTEEVLIHKKDMNSRMQSIRIPASCLAPKIEALCSWLSRVHRSV